MTADKCPVCGATLIIAFSALQHHATQKFLICPHTHPYVVPQNYGIKAMVFFCNFIVDASRPTPQQQTQTNIPIMPQIAQPNSNDKNVKFAVPMLNGKTLLFTDLNKTDIALSLNSTVDSIGTLKKSDFKKIAKAI